MQPYTHAVLASQMMAQVNPGDPAEYLWGALAPDIRYLAGMRRQTTHRPDEEIVGWFERYPGCASFIQGYRVHCLLDRIDAVQAVGGAFPLNLVGRVRRKPFSMQQMVGVIELYYQKYFQNGLTLAGGHNPILEELGVRAELSTEFRAALAGYLATPTFEAAVACFARFGIIEDARIEKYIRAFNQMRANPVLLRLLMLGVKNARLEKLASSLI